MVTLVGIAIKRKTREPMELLENAEVTVETGIAGDYRGAKPGKRLRQVTILSEEDWLEACNETKANLPWETRRANLLVRGLKFGPEYVGKNLKIGESVILEITGETVPCSRMDEALQGLKQVLTSSWRGGVTCKIITGGQIKIGDKVVVV